MNNISNNKQPLSLISATVFLLFFNFLPSSYAETNLLKSALELNCGLAHGFPPYQFVSGSDQPQGFDVAVIQAIAKRNGHRLTLHPDSWKTSYMNLKRDKGLNCIIGIEVTEAREKAFLFSQAYYKRHSAIFTLADRDDIATITDLKGLRITGDAHSSTERILHERGLLDQIMVYRTTSKNQAFWMLKKGSCDAVIAPLAVGRHLAKKQNLQLKVFFNEDPGTPVAIAVTKSNPQLAQQIDSALDEMRQDGSLEKLRQQWLYDSQ